jgi:hypothetical protein
MRAPDRIRGGADLPEVSPRAADAQDHADRDLAYRLARLPGSHPSAGPARDWRSAEYSEPGLQEWWRPVADGQDDEAAGEPYDLADEPDDGADEPDDAPHSEDAELDEFAEEPGRRAVGAHAERRGEPFGMSGELSRPSARSAYRPWFSADGAGDPWFAARPPTLG